MRIGRGYPQQSFSVAGQALGPREPAVINPAPLAPPIQVNLAVGLATNQRRDQMRFPLQGWEGSQSFLTDTTDGPEGFARNLGPRPPLVVGPIVYPPVETVIGVTLTATRTRADQQRRFPLQGWEGTSVTASTPISLLDDFNRGNANPAGRSWTKITGAAGDMQIVSNRLGGTAVGAQSGAYWNVAGFPANVELQATFAVVDNQYGSIFFRIQNPRAATISCYELRPNASGLGNIELRKYVAGTSSVIVDSGVSIGGNGDIYLIRCVGNQIQVWWNQTGVSPFVLIINVTDSTFTQGGYIGLGMGNTTGKWDDFSAVAYQEGTFGQVSRLLGPRPPVLVVFVPPAVETVVSVAVPAVAVMRRAQAQRHFSKSLLFPPATLAQPPPSTPLLVSFANAVKASRRTNRGGAAWLMPPVVLGPVAQPPAVTTLTASLVVPDRLERRKFNSFLFPPSVVEPSLQPPDRRLRIVVALAGRTRQEQQRRFPLQGWEQVPTYQQQSASRSIIANPGGGTQGFGAAATSTSFAESFVLPAVAVSAVAFRLSGFGVVTDDVVAEIWTNAGGVPGTVIATSAPVTGSTIPISPATAFTTFSFSQPAPVIGKTWFAVRRTGAFDPTNRYGVGVGIPQIGDGKKLDTTSGNVWTSTFTIALTVSYALGSPVLQQRFLGPRPPMIVNPPPSQQQQTVVVGPPSVAVGRAQAQHRVTKSYLFPPATLAQPPPAPYAVAVHSIAASRARPARVSSRFAGPVVVFAPPLAPPITVTLARRLSPRRTRSSLPLVVVTATTFVAPPISVNLQDNRVRGFGRRDFPGSVLYPPQALQTFAAGKPTLSRTRPRPTIHVLGKPTVVRVPSVEQQEQTIKASLVRIRPRHTISFIFPPVTAPQAVVLYPVRVALAHTRPRPVIRTLGKPTALQTFTAGRPALVRVRPRPTAKRLAPPTVIRVPSVEQRERTIATPLVRTRPRPTTKRLQPPAVVRVPSVEQQEDTVKVTLVRARPRPTTKALGEPQTLQVFTGPQVETVHTRPRQTTHRLSPPTFVRVPAVEQQEDTIRTALVRTRPRPTARFLAEPTVLSVFAGPFVALTKITPRPTVTHLTPPTVVRVPSVEQAEDTIRVSLVRTRPRHTVAALFAPTALKVFAGAAVHLARIKPRPTARRLAPPTVVIPLPTLRMQTVQVALVRIRPRKTIYKIEPPTVISTTALTLAQETIHLALARIRPRPTRRFLRPPTVVIPLPTLRVQTIQTKLVRTLPRHTISKLFFSPVVSRIPSVEQRLRTIQTTLVETRPRPTIAALLPPTVLRVFDGPAVTLVQTRPRPTTKRLRPPTRVQAAFVAEPITVAFTRIRPARTHSKLPLVLRQPIFRPVAVTLTETRPRPTTAVLAPPVVIRRQPVETTIKTALVVTRPRPVTSTLAAPAVVRYAPLVTTISTKLVETRPRPTHPVLVPPTQVSFSGRIVTALVRRVTRPAIYRLQPPTVIRPPVPVVTTLGITLAVAANRFRHRPVIHRQPPIIPVIFGKPGVVTGYTIGAYGAEGRDIGGAKGEERDIAGAGSGGQARAGAGTTIRDVPGAASEGRDERSTA